MLPETCASKKKGTNDVGSSLSSVWQFGSLAVWSSLAEQFGQPNLQTAFPSSFKICQFSKSKNESDVLSRCESPNHSPRPLAPFFGHCLTHRSGFAAGQPRRRVSSEARARHSSAQPRTWRRFRGTTHPRAEVPFLLVTTKCALFCWWPRASWRSSILPRADDRSTMIHLQRRRTLRC